MPTFRITERMAKSTPFYYGWAVLFGAGTSQFVRNAAASLTLAVFMYPISEDLGWSRTLIAGAASAGGLAATAASPFVGWIVDRYGARVVLATSVLVLGFSTISLSWATIPIAFYLAYGIGRVIFSSPIQIGASVVVSRWFVARRGRATGLLFLSHSIGMTLFPLLAAVIIQARGWQDAWLIMGILVWVIALGPVSLLIVQRPEDIGMVPDGMAGETSGRTNVPASLAEDSWTLREAARTPALWLLAVAGGLLFVVHSGINIHLVAYFRDQDLGATVAASSISVGAIFTGVGSLFWGWVIERVQARYAFACVALLMAISSILFIGADTITQAFAITALFGFSLAGVLVIPPVAFADYFGRGSLGKIRGVTEPFVTMGQAVGAILSGGIYDKTGSYQAAFATFVVVGLATMVILLLAKPPQRHLVTKSSEIPPEQKK